jgi:hypothetical protein
MTCVISSLCLELDQLNRIHVGEAAEPIEDVFGGDSVQVKDAEGFSPQLISAELHVADIDLLFPQGGSYASDDTGLIEGVY